MGRSPGLHNRARRRLRSLAKSKPLLHFLDAGGRAKPVDLPAHESGLKAVKDRGTKLGSFRGYVSDADTGAEGNRKAAEAFAERVGQAVMGCAIGACP